MYLISPCVLYRDMFHHFEVTLTQKHKRVYVRKEKVKSQISDYIIMFLRYTILPKVLGRPLLMNRFDYCSNFYEYKS